MKTRNITACLFCDQKSFRDVFEYESPPAGETIFNSIPPKNYYRKIILCEICGHFYSTYQLNLNHFYKSEYNRSTYQDKDGMRQTFERIIQLDPTKSDNTARCDRIENFLRKKNPQRTQNNYKILDVGSGLGVFPYVMVKRGYQVTALDPDPQAIDHIQSCVDIPTLCGDFLQMEPEEHYDLIVFNKVLEHVENPIAMLTRSAEFLKKDGLFYIELPDGEMAKYEGAGREEFFIDHLHVFSFASMTLLAARSGFTVLEIERLREPSTKFTLRAFLTRKD